MKGKRVCKKHQQAFEAGDKCEYCEDVPDTRADVDVEQTVGSHEVWGVSYFPFGMAGE
jgi:hypothetical protein